VLHSLWLSILHDFTGNVATYKRIIKDVAYILLLYIGARIIIRVLLRATHRVLQLNAVRLNDRRKNTFASLLDNAIRYTVYVIFILTALPVVGVHIETLLAGAGIAGLAIGFGAQSLIKDLLTGFFILFEDQYGVGDMVKVNNFTGTVFSIGLRLTRIQAWTGEIEIIPNGQIITVTNYSKTNSVAVIDVGVAYDTDINQATQALLAVMNDLPSENDSVIGEAQVLGVQSLGPSEVVLRAIVTCRPTTQYGVQRLAQQRIKEKFDALGIEIPFPQSVVHLQPSPDTERALRDTAAK